MKFILGFSERLNELPLHLATTVILLPLLVDRQYAKIYPGLEMIFFIANAGFISIIMI